MKIDQEIHSLYAQAKLIGLEPYEFDNHIIRHNIFKLKKGKVCGINPKKFKRAALNVLAQMKGLENHG